MRPTVHLRPILVRLGECCPVSVLIRRVGVSRRLPCRMSASGLLDADKKNAPTTAEATDNFRMLAIAVLDMKGWSLAMARGCSYRTASSAMCIVI